MSTQNSPSGRERCAVIELPIASDRGAVRPRPGALFVDDDEALLDGLRRSQRAEFTVYTAPSAEAALRVLKADPLIAVVVADLNMPHTDGASFLSLARRRFPSVVRIVLSGHSDMGQAARAVNDGAIFRFLTKPCPAPELSRILAAAVQRRAKDGIGLAAAEATDDAAPCSVATAATSWDPGVCAACPIGDLRDGMVFAEDLATRDGLALLPRGFVLTQSTRRHIVERFRGVLPASVRVRIPPAAPGPAR